MIAPHSKDYKSSKIFPCPQQEQVFSERYQLKQKYDTTDLFEFYTSVKGGSKDISYGTDSSFEREEYTLDIDDNGIKIVSATEEGKYRAITSLRLIIDADGESLEHCKIKDKPDLNSRMWMLDIGHARRNTAADLKEHLDFMTGLKYNCVCFYMEPLCFKYPNFPEYTDFPCLTPEELVELDKYAKERYIELIPNINGFGHMLEWLSIDEFKHLAVGDGVRPSATINPLLDESLEFIDRLYGSILPYFTSKRAFIGFDEANGLGAYQTKEACEEKGKTAVAIDWLKKVAALTHDKYGFEEVIVCQDMFIEDAECFRDFPDYVTVDNWNYSQTQIPLIEGQLTRLKENGIKKFYTVSASETYGIFTWRADLAIDNIRLNAEMAHRQGADGMMLTEWTTIYSVWEYLPCAFAANMMWKVGGHQETDHAYFKTEYMHEGEKYLDKYLFKGPLSRLIYQFGGVYNLEPERIHGGAISGMSVQYPITMQKVPYFFDMAVVGDDFYFDNMEDYINKLICKVELVDCDENFKREVILSARMYLFATECCRAKYHLNVTKEKYEEIKKLCNWIIKENKEIWPLKNYTAVPGTYLECFEQRLKEMAELVK